MGRGGGGNMASRMRWRKSLARAVLMLDTCVRVCACVRVCVCVCVCVCV